MEPVEAVGPPAGDYQSVLEVANSIEANRLKMERLRREKREQQMETLPAAVAPDDNRPPAAWLYYPPVRGYRPHYPYLPA